MISLSLVSHGQAELAAAVLSDLAGLDGAEGFEVILTCNLPETLPFAARDFPFSLTVLQNANPKGFGANHNAAFTLARGEYFCVMNPDLRLPVNPFPGLIDELRRSNAALAAPAVLNPAGAVEDSVRRFPTPGGLLAKLLGRGDGRHAMTLGEAPFAADWVGGMFMLFRADAFRAVGGFDEGFFLYYEDVDICARLWKSGWRVLACPAAQVVHNARRASHRDVRYLSWHLASLARYLRKHWLRLPKTEAAR